MPPVRVAIVNDYEIVVAGVAEVLAPYRDRVHVVELDSRMPVLRDVDVVLYDSFGQVQGDDIDVSSLVADGTAKIVVFSWNTEAAVVDGALRQGAHSYLSKGLSGEALVASLERIQAGDRLTPATEAMPEGDQFGRWPGDGHGLSAREAEVLALICQGLSNQEVASRAFLGINTIKTHIRHLYRKIGVTSRTQAVVWARQNGFMPDRGRIAD